MVNGYHLINLNVQICNNLGSYSIQNLYVHYRTCVRYIFLVNNSFHFTVKPKNRFDNTRQYILNFLNEETWKSLPNSSTFRFGFPPTCTLTPNKSELLHACSVSVKSSQSCVLNQLLTYTTYNSYTILRQMIEMKRAK